MVIKFNSKAQLFLFDSLTYFIIILLLFFLLLSFLSAKTTEIQENQKNKELLFFALDYSEYLTSNLLAKKDTEKKRILENIFSQQSIPKIDYSPFLIKEISLNNSQIFSQQTQSKDCIYIERLILNQNPEILKIGVCYKS